MAGTYQRGIEARLPSGALAWVKTLEQFDFDFQPAWTGRMVRELTGLSLIERANNVILLGPPGVGKTHLAICPGCQSRRSRLFVAVPDLEP